MDGVYMRQLESFKLSKPGGDEIVSGSNDKYYACPILQHAQELIRRDACLTQNTRQCADLYFFMVGNNATTGAFPHDDVTTALARHHKTQTLQRLDRLRAGDMRKFRHERGVRTWSPTGDPM